jgi:hypothetical protein
MAINLIFIYVVNLKYLSRENVYPEHVHTCFTCQHVATYRAQLSLFNFIAQTIFGIKYYRKFSSSMFLRSLVTDVSQTQCLFRKIFSYFYCKVNAKDKLCPRHDNIIMLWLYYYYYHHHHHHRHINLSF